MKSIPRIWLSLLTLTVGFAATVRAQQVAEHAISTESIATALLSSNRQTRIQALNAYIVTPEEERTSAMSDALIRALEDEGRLIQSRSRGEAPALRESDHEYPLILAKEVIELEDSKAIPAIALMMGSGAAPGRALVELGHVALTEVLSVVQQPAVMNKSTIRGGILTLTRMVEQWGLPTFTSDEVEQMIQIATRYLDDEPDALVPPSVLGSNPWLLVLRAVHLAVVLQDDRLREIVEALSADKEALRERGITDPRWQKMIQETATTLLAGESYRP